MAGLINNLMERLAEMADGLAGLHEAAEAKKDIIIKNDLDLLKRVTAHENTLVGRYQKSEKAAAAILSDIASVLNQSRDELTLSRLGELIKSQAEHGAYMAVYARLKEAADTLKAANDANNQLIENALDYIEYTVNVLRSTYGNDGEAIVDSIN